MPKKTTCTLSANTYGYGTIAARVLGCWQLSNWVIVPRAWPIGQENTAQEWLDIVRVFARKGQGELMGSFHYPRIPFILVRIHQSDLSPLLDLYSADPLVDPKPHTSIQAIVFFSLSWFSQSPMVMWLWSMFRLSLSQLHHITLFFHNHNISCLLSTPLYSTAYTFLIVSIFISVL